MRPRGTTGTDSKVTDSKLSGSPGYTQVLATAPVVPADVLPDYFLQAAASLFDIVADYERRIIMEHLELASGSQTEATESLHAPLSTLNQKIKRLNIEVRNKSANP